jgi:hypothetical protein
MLMRFQTRGSGKIEGCRQWRANPLAQELSKILRRRPASSHGRIDAFSRMLFGHYEFHVGPGFSPDMWN